MQMLSGKSERNGVQFSLFLIILLVLSVNVCKQGYNIQTHSKIHLNILQNFSFTTGRFRMCFSYLFFFRLHCFHHGQRRFLLLLLLVVLQW